MTDTRTPNVELLHTILDYIKAHPEEWEQKNWITTFNLESKDTYEKVGVEVPACGTAFCFAGHALAMNGIDIKVDNQSHIYSYDYQKDAELNEEDTYAKVGTGYHTTNGNPVPDIAAEILGLGPRQASTLFLAYNKLSDLELIVEQIINGELPYDYDDDEYEDAWDSRDYDQEDED